LFVDLDIQIGLFVCCVALINFFLIQSFIAGSGCVVCTPAITAGFFWFAIAQGSCGIRGLAFGVASFAFAFGAIMIGSRWLAVSEVEVGFVATASSSLAHVSAFAFIVFAFAFVSVRVVERCRIVTQFFLFVT
jgi:hypothetical protein